jgi:uncharacterized protein
VIIVEQPQRINIIDQLRGFSLLGILLANMLIFQYGLFGKDELHLFHPGTADTAAHSLLRIFVEGSFMPIFTFLFGYGMIKMKDSLHAKGLKAGRHLIRRALFLIAAGLLHSQFLWDGDILFFYGTMMFFLLIFMNRKAKTLLVWGIVLLTLFGLIGLVPADSGSAAMLQANQLHTENYVKETIALYGSGTYSEIMNHRDHADPFGEMDGGFILFALLLAPLLTAPLFLFGMAAANRNRFVHHEQERGSNSMRAAILIPAGLLLKTAGVLLEGYDWSTACLIIGANLLALGFIFALASMFSRIQSSVWAARFAAVGRMSLTNYLLQTVICTTLFYGYGLGWFGKIGVIAGCLLALAIYTAQLLFSSWFLARFKSGPVERLLRMWTYFTWTGKAKRPRQAGIAAPAASPSQPQA